MKLIYEYGQGLRSWIKKHELFQKINIQDIIIFSITYILLIIKLYFILLHRSSSSHSIQILLYSTLPYIFNKKKTKNPKNPKSKKFQKFQKGPKSTKSLKKVQKIQKVQKGQKKQKVWKVWKVSKIQKVQKVQKVQKIQKVQKVKK